MCAYKNQQMYFHFLLAQIAAPFQITHLHKVVKNTSQHKELQNLSVCKRKDLTEMGEVNNDYVC